MKKQEICTLLSAAVTATMALIMTWINLPYPGNHGGPKFLMMGLLLFLWCGAWLHYRFPQRCRFFQQAISQSLGIAMGFWIFAAGELVFRLRWRYSSMNNWILFGIFGVIFMLILLTGGVSLKQEEE